MPLVTLHLIALSSGKEPSGYVNALRSHSVRPIVAARIIRWIIKPELLSVEQLLGTAWDLFIVVAKDSPLPGIYLTEHWVQRNWSITAGVPSRVLNGYVEKNERLLFPREDNIPPLTGSMQRPRMAKSAQGLELNDELLEWSATFKLGQTGAVSMLNLLAFRTEQGSDESYRKYGKAFAESIGSRRGGDAKLVGKVVATQSSSDEDQSGWEEFALAHYPSIRHFVDMIASEDYQSVNHQYRLPSLRDTCILCTTELDLGHMSDKARL